MMDVKKIYSDDKYPCPVCGKKMFVYNNAIGDFSNWTF